MWWIGNRNFQSSNSPKHRGGRWHTSISPYYTDTHNAPTLRLLVCPTILYYTCCTILLRCYAFLFIPITTYTRDDAYIRGVLIYAASYCILFYNCGSGISSLAKWWTRHFHIMPNFLNYTRVDKSLFCKRGGGGFGNLISRPSTCVILHPTFQRGRWHTLFLLRYTIL